MEDIPHSSNVRATIGRYAALALACLGAAGCAGRSPTPAGAPAGYRVYFSATRLKDHTVLVAGSTPAFLGQTAQVRTASTVAAEDLPALPNFAATVSLTRTPGMVQLITKTSIRELVRTKKGKLRLTKRDQGALLPVRLGEAQNASPTGDPVQIEVRVERR